MQELGIIFIPFSVPSSKNGKRYFRGRVIKSEATIKWKNLTKEYWRGSDKEYFLKLTKGLDNPLLIGFHFVRSSDQPYDFVGPLETVQDEMILYEWINDDNVFRIIPFPFEMNGAYSTVNKKNPGVYIKIFKK